MHFIYLFDTCIYLNFNNACISPYVVLPLYIYVCILFHGFTNVFFGMSQRASVIIEQQASEPKKMEAVVFSRKQLFNALLES